MKHRSRPEKQEELFRPSLADMRHEVVTFADRIDWEFFEIEWDDFFLSSKGYPATSPCLVVGLMYRQNNHRLSDDAAVARWVENPYLRLFTGVAFFEHPPPARVCWRKQIEEEGVE